MPQQIRIAILGSNTEPIQSIYLPILSSHPNYQIASLYDPSTPDPSPQSILSDSSITLCLNFLPLATRESYTIAALEAGKSVLVQPPISPSIQGAKRILEAERKYARNGARVYVSCGRRHAPCVEEVFKKEVAGLDRIYYARCRNIAGPGMLGLKDFPPVQTDGHTNGDTKPKPETTTTPIDLQEVFDTHDLTPERLSLYNFLSSLGCHDLALLRETLGIPDAVSSVSVNDPFYSAIFHYTDGRADEIEDTHRPYTLVYETGADSMPRCDAHLAVYGQSKTVTIQYDLPYAPNKPAKVIVEERDPKGQVKKTEFETSWEEMYRAELDELYKCLTGGGSAGLMGAADGLMDLRLFRLMFEQYDRQCGTIRTPLG